MQNLSSVVTNFVGGRSSAPDPAAEAHNVPPDPVGASRRGTATVLTTAIPKIQAPSPVSIYFNHWIQAPKSICLALPLAGCPSQRQPIPFHAFSTGIGTWYV